jgi:ketosteroid isomerase-like protein
VSHANVELIQSGYKAWNEGDIDAVLRTLDPEVEWHGHPRLPEPGPFAGREAVGRWFASVREALEALAVSPLAYVEAGNSVVVPVHITGRGRGSGVEVESGVDAHIWTFAGGRIVRFLWLQGDETARRARLTRAEGELLRLRAATDLADAEIAERLDLTPGELVAVSEEAIAKLGVLAEGES